MIRILLRISLSLFLAIFLTNCDPRMLYDEQQTIASDGWDMNKKAVFSFEARDTASLYNIYINVRNDGAYKYNNLILFIDVRSPEGNLLKDTVDIQLAQANGQWLGKGFGHLWLLKASWKSNIRFPSPGVYTLELSQGMREDILTHITDIGIRVEKAKL